MQHKTLRVLPTLVVAALALFAAASAAYADDEPKLGPYKKIDTVTVPSGFIFLGGGFDISWVDSDHGRYYLADRGNPNSTPKVSPGIDVIDTRHDKFLYEIPLSTSANGVVVIHRGSEDDGEGENGFGTLVAGGTDSTTIFIDLSHPMAAPLAVSTGGNHRADELAFDPIDSIILIANDQDTPHPFVTFISTATHSVLGKIIYDGSSAGNPLSTGGIEQPVWDGVTQRFYIAIPSTALNPKGEIDEINPLTEKITRIFKTTCGPAGLALIPGQNLMTSCGDVVAVSTGSVVTTVAGVSADEIWFNPGDDRVYFGSFVTSFVVSALPPYSVIPGGLPWTGHFSPPAQFSHSIAADSENNHIFVPVTNLGVLVFTDSTSNSANDQ
jgi:hypothetical protein